MWNWLITGLLCLFMTVCAVAGPLFNCEWNNDTVARVWKESKPGNDFSVSARNGFLILTMTAHNGKSDVGGRQIWMNRNFKAEKGAVYRIRFQASASVPGKLGIGGYESGGQWRTLGTPVSVDLFPESAGGELELCLCTR